jgi:hypothetical protein
MYRGKRGMKKIPDGVVCVDRPSRFCNPFYTMTYSIRQRGIPWTTIHLADRLGVKVCSFLCESKEEAVDKFKRWLVEGRLEITVDDVRQELRGKDLACFDRDHQPSHADILIEIANRDE